jgi:hypothetical protein
MTLRPSESLMSQFQEVFIMIRGSDLVVRSAAKFLADMAISCPES